MAPPLEAGTACIWMPILGEGVFRFDSSEKAREEAWPSLSFMHPKQRETPLQRLDKEPTVFPQYFPQCSFQHEKQIMTIQLPEDTFFYGTGEVSGPLERTGQRVSTWNTDAWGYGSSTTPLYQSHPWVLAILPDGQALGVLADTTRRCEIDLRKESTIKYAAESPFPIITFGPFASPTQVLATLSQATGTLSMPPKWSLGYHQCRYSYEPDSRVLEIANTFREKRIPCDVLWMDIDYMDGFRCFTFDPEKFSSPKSLAKGLHSKGFKTVWMLDPGIKVESGYFAYDTGSSQDAWILSSDGKAYTGDVWPGLCVFPDYTSSKIRKWWANLVRRFVVNGVDGIWNDMNEPAVLKTLTKTMPETNIHLGDAELGGSQSHSHYHNVYGMLMARSTSEGMLLGDAKKRPFVLSRAGFIGSQRYAATWTGDNTSSWDHLSMSVPMALNLGLSGQPFSGPDIGGFAGNATPELFSRWMGIGTLLPFSRGHSEKGTVDHEPWSFGAECERACRQAIERRYRLLPHIYTLFYNTHTKGEPVMSPLFFADTTDLRLRKVEDSFLLGPMLVSLSKDKQQGSTAKQTILPSGIWKEFDFEDSHDDLPLLFLKGGSIIPTGPVVQNTEEMLASNDLTLIVALDKSGEAEGLLYEDDGDGFEYQKGKYLLTSYEASLQGDELCVRVKWSKGQLQRQRRALKVHLLVGETAKVVFCGTDGEEIKFQLPKPSEIAKLVAEAERKKTSVADTVKTKLANANGVNGVEVQREILELSGGSWNVKLMPWLGGRLISMIHLPTGIDWLWGKADILGYAEYSGIDSQSPGCTEEYSIVKQDDAAQNGLSTSIFMEGDIGGGVALCRDISLQKGSPKALNINSYLVAKSEMAGSGGFSSSWPARSQKKKHEEHLVPLVFFLPLVVCLRVHPTFQLNNPLETFVIFTSLDGNSHTISREIQELCLHGHERPNGEWMLVDKCANVSLVNKFNLEEVEQCLIYWGPETCTLELRTTERPVSKASPLSIHHAYETNFEEM